MTTPELQTAVASHPFLKDLPPDQLRVLGTFAMQTHFESGQTIFREGDIANRFYLIQRGRVALGSFAESQTHMLNQVIIDGDVLGWSWIYPPYAWQFDARALEPTDAIFFYATPLREQCEQDHDLGYELMKRFAAVMMERLQSVRGELLTLVRLQRASS